jgi:hypothetical protein
MSCIGFVFCFRSEESDEFFGTEKDAAILAGWSSCGVPELMRVYAALAEAAKAAIAHFATDANGNAQSARQVAVDTLIASTKVSPSDSIYHPLSPTWHTHKHLHTHAHAHTSTRELARARTTTQVQQL